MCIRDSSLAEANISLTGLLTDGGSGSVSLIANGGTISETGTLIAGTLSGSSTGSTTLNSLSNQVAGLSSFAAAGFTLNDGVNLAVSGTLNGGTSAAITDTESLSIGGTVTAAAISLNGGDISISGLATNGGGGTLSLVATSGTINETGTLITGTLTGSSTGLTTLTGATLTSNQILVLENFTASGFTLNDGEALSVAGVVNGGASATITSSAMLAIPGTVTATAISLLGTAIAIPGLVSGTGTVNLMASGGTISEIGTLIAGTLTGSSTGATTLNGATATTNQIASIDNFTAAGFTLNDGLALSVIGTLKGGASAIITDSALVSIGGTLSASLISLTAASIAIPGLVTDGGGGTVSLIANGGTIDEQGTLIAGSLSGTSTGATTLTGASAGSNQVATLTGFTASGFTLNDGAALTVSGVVNGGPSATITDLALLTIDGTRCV